MFKNKLFWIVVGVVVIAGGFGWWRMRQAKANAALQFETARIDRGKIVAKVTASGSLSAIVTVQVGSQVSGRIAALYADFNSKVKKGELIAKIDPQLFQANVAQARANYVAAQGNLAKAKAQALDAERQYKRSVTLAERKLIAQADLDTAQATADAAKAGVDAAVGSVEQAKAQLHSAEVNLAYTDIISPTDGVVISRNVDVGQTVAASLQAPTLFLIAEDLRKMQVDTSVAEADIGQLRTGMSATFTVDAYPTETFVGTVRQIRNAPQTVQNVVTYDAVIDVDNSGLKLKPGMTANCTFIYAEQDDALRVPNAALRFRPPAELLAGLNPGGTTGGRGPRGAGAPAAGAAGAAPAKPGGSTDRKTVWVLRAGKPFRVAIRTGVTDGIMSEVVEGDLSVGDSVITDVSGGTAAGQRGFAGRMF
ncbi:MAG: efflux RND transporter periplasmic adaptor subunit [Thermoanaerobaculaceae bacterium]|nr:efflux RND transporter periplasmic adaptor subunit [Thermoanaerobaculaceae bacterium]